MEKGFLPPKTTSKVFSKSFWSGTKSPSKQESQSSVGTEQLAVLATNTTPALTTPNSNNVQPVQTQKIAVNEKVSQIDDKPLLPKQESNLQSNGSFCFTPPPPPPSGDGISYLESQIGSSSSQLGTGATSSMPGTGFNSSTSISYEAAQMMEEPSYSFHDVDVMRSQNAELRDFQLLKMAGKGGFAKVYEAKRIQDGKIFALKVMRKDVIKKLRQANHIMNEKNILKAMSKCRFIAHILTTFQDSIHLFMIQEFMAGGDLFAFIKEQGYLQDKHAQFYAAEIFLGIEFLHENGIVYRDLKPENIMFDSHGHIRLADLGFAKEIKDGTTATFCGTPSYLAPEVLQKKPYGLQVDWWTFGVVIFQLCSGCSPFQESHPTKTFSRILHCTIRWPPDPQLYFSNDSFDIITQLLELDPVERLVPIEIREHDWFASITWDLMEKGLVEPPLLNLHNKRFNRAKEADIMNMNIELSSGVSTQSNEKLFADF